MTFWTVMLATMTGIFIANIIVAVIKSLPDIIRGHSERRKEENRKIGFGSELKPAVKTEEPRMWKIGFGENDWYLKGG